MKFSRLDFILYIKQGCLRRRLYLIASVIILVPMLIVLVSDIPFTSSVSKLFISIAFVLAITGKLMTFIEKTKGDKSSPADIGIIIGILIAFIGFLLK